MPCTAMHRLRTLEASDWAARAASWRNRKGPTYVASTYVRRHWGRVENVQLVGFPKHLGTLND